MAFHFPLNKLAQDLYDVAFWHLIFLLPQWCLVLPPRGGAIRHRETQIGFKCFLMGEWENLQEEFFLRAQLWRVGLSSMLLPQNDPLAHKHHLHNLVFRHVGEYS